MSTRETYAFVYSGVGGVGIGLFSITDGVVEGRDYAGAVYAGTATETSQGTIDFTITVQVPEGVNMTYGTAPQDLPYSRSFQHTFPKGFGEGTPQTVETGVGTLYVMISRVADEFHNGVESGFTLSLAGKLAGAAT